MIDDAGRPPGGEEEASDVTPPGEVVADAAADVPPAPDPTPAAGREPTADRAPTAEPAPTVDVEPTADLAPTAEPAPPVDVEPTADLAPTAEPAPTVDVELTADLEPIAEPAPAAELEPAADLAPIGDFEPIVEPAPTTGAQLSEDQSIAAATEPVPTPDLEPAGLVQVALAPSAEPPTALPGPVPQPAAAVPADLVPLTELAPAIAEVSVSRRAFLGFGMTVAGGLAGAAFLTRYFPIFSEPATEPPPIVPTYDPLGKAWTFVVDTASCIGCGLCVVACKAENEVTDDPRFSRTWVERHAVALDGTVYIDSPAGGANGFPPASTAAGAEGQVIDRAFFEPRLCMQCEESPCTAVCPVGATYRTADGIILVDARRCIGCGYCVVACPYGARYIAPAGDQAPNGTPGVADKCTWCYHRISRGLLPACVDICPVGARKFGDASDPDSEIATIVRERAPKPFHPEYGTRPRVLYLGPAVEEA